MSRIPLEMKDKYADGLPESEYLEFINTCDALGIQRVHDSWYLMESDVQKILDSLPKESKLRGRIKRTLYRMTYLGEI